MLTYSGTSWQKHSVNLTAVLTTPSRASEELSAIKPVPLGREHLSPRLGLAAPSPLWPRLRDIKGHKDTPAARPRWSVR